MKAKGLLYAIAMVMTIYIIASCGLSENTERKVAGEFKFTIEPESVVQSIANGKEDAFSLADPDYEPGELYSESVMWKQSDYLRIVDALHKNVWGDSVHEWSLNYMSFSLPCNEVNMGFQWASFSLFQKNSITGNYEIEHQIDIYPRRKLINAWEYVYNSKLSRLTSVETTSTILEAEKVLMIAESSGGRERRLGLDNQCEISVIFSPNSVNYRGWKAVYSPGNYFINIDPITGRLVK